MRQSLIWMHSVVMKEKVVVLGVVGCAEEKEALFAGARYVD